MLNYGEQRYGEKYTQALVATEHTYGTLRNAKYVSARVELSRRRDNLLFSHHQEAASLETTEEQDEWLARADSEGMQVKEMRKAIRVYKQLLQPSPPLPDGRFRVIYADPPWKYGDELIEGYGV